MTSLAGETGKVRTIARSHHFIGDEDVAIVYHEVNRKTRLHVHEFFEMVYVEQGTLLHRYGPTVHEVTAGDFFIVNPTVPHGYDLTANGSAQIWNIILTEDALSMLTLESDMAVMIGELIGHKRYALAYRSLRLSEEVNVRVRSLVKEMGAEFTEKNQGYRMVLKGYLITLVGLISRALKESGMSVQPLSSPQSKLGEITRYIVDHCDQPLTVEQLAHQYGWTPDHLNRMLKKMTGDTVQAYIGRIRAARAARILLTENVTVDEVARRVGYSDARTLRRAFRRYHGVSPAEFRKASYL